MKVLVLSAEKCWKLTAEKCMFLIAFYTNDYKRSNCTVELMLYMLWTRL